MAPLLVSPAHAQCAIRKSAQIHIDYSAKKAPDPRTRGQEPARLFEATLQRLYSRFALHHLAQVLLWYLRRWIAVPTPSSSTIPTFIPYELAETLLTTSSYILDTLHYTNCIEIP